MLPFLLKTDRSSWVSWIAYGATFALAVGLHPASADDVLRFGPGAAVLLAGIGLFFAAVVALQRHMRLTLTSAHYGAPRALLTDGVFRISRNPIYLAFLMPILSLAVYSPVAAGLGAVGYVLAMTRFVIANEERDLEAIFPEAFAAYRKATPRWLLG